MKNSMKNRSENFKGEPVRSPRVQAVNWGSRVGPALLLFLLTLAGSYSTPVVAGQQTTPPSAVQKIESLQDVVAKQAALVTEFDVNGLKVLIKRREGSLTVAAGLFIRGGVRNITAENAGIESLMLSTATEASTNFPRQR